MPAAPCAACAAALPWSSPSGSRPISFPCKYIMRNSIGVTHLLSREYREETVRESKGHPYAIKMLLGEVAKAGETTKVARIVVSREDVLTALFERTYTGLSPAASRVFLTLCHWRVNVPLLALEAVMVRPENEAMSVEEAVDELRRVSFVDDLQSAIDNELFLNVPLAAAEFGRRKLAVSSIKSAIEADTELLQLFGPGAPGDVKRGIAPRIQHLARLVAKKIQAGGSLDHYIRIVEFVALRYNPAWLITARLFEESGAVNGRDKAKEALSRFLETAPPEEAYAEWRHLAHLSVSSGDVMGEVHALVERCELPMASFDDMSYAASRVNMSLRDHHSAFSAGEKTVLVSRLAKVMERRADEGDATDLSRLAWLYLHLNDQKHAEIHVSRGLSMDPENEFCRSLAVRLER